MAHQQLSPSRVVWAIEHRPHGPFGVALGRPLPPLSFSAPPASSARSFCRTSTKAPSGFAARSRPAPVPPSPRTSRTARRHLAAFPEVTEVVSQIGRPDDGTDTTGFFNTEYFVDLKPKRRVATRLSREQGRVDRRHEPRAFEKSPGVVWNFSQPISDNVEEAVSGVKGELAVKLYGTISRRLRPRATRSLGLCRTSRASPISACSASSVSPT